MECEARNEGEGMMCTGRAGEAPTGTAVATAGAGAAGTGFPAREAPAASTSPAAEASRYRCTACTCSTCMSEQRWKVIAFHQSFAPASVSELSHYLIGCSTVLE